MKKIICLLIVIGLVLMIWFFTTPTFCKWKTNRNFQRRIKADGRYDAMDKKLVDLGKYAFVDQNDTIYISSNAEGGVIYCRFDKDGWIEIYDPNK